MFYLYGYNGSGLPMSVKVEVVAGPFDDGTAVVEFVDAVPPFDALTESDGFDSGRTVMADRLHESPPRDPASFNWLD